MKTRHLLSASLLFLALACGGADDETSGLFDGSSLDGWSSAGDPSISLNLNDDALDVRGDSAAGASFSLAVEGGEGSVGITFRIRGSQNVRFSATTAGVKPVEAGGTCVPTDTLGCWDLHGAPLNLTTEWVTVTLSWEQLQQEGWGVPAQFDPATVTHINFHTLGEGVFNIWIDDVAFVQSLDTGVTPVGDGDMTGTGGDATGTGGDGMGAGEDMPGTGGAAPTGGSTNMSDNRLGRYVSNVMFLQQFSGRNTIYSYSELLAAVDQFPDFAACCSETQQKREVAAFLAHVEHESDRLNATDEYTPPTTYCQVGQYMCAPGKSYHGRGALQLTWNYNYQFAQDFFQTQGKTYDLVARPEQVSTDPELLWTTALWFWMEGDPSFVNDSPHDRMGTAGFGSTIDKINGALECNGAGPTQVQQRIDFYNKWCNLLGVDPGTNLSC